MKNNNWGGNRPGAGRPAIHLRNIKQVLSVRVAPILLRELKNHLLSIEQSKSDFVAVAIAEKILRDNKTRSVASGNLKLIKTMLSGPCNLAHVIENED
jgi:hypothetical protein